MSDDDDVSIIALSDDEGSKPSQTPKAPSPPATGTQRVSFAPVNEAGSSSKRVSKESGGHRSGSKHLHGGKGSRTVEPVVYEEDEDEQSEHAEHYEDDEEEEGEYYQAGGDTVLDEEGLDYISDRFASRQEHGSGPSTWLEVNEAEIKEVAENLLQNINKSHKNDNVLQYIFMSSSVVTAKEMQDPLGMGTFDPTNLTLRQMADGESFEDLQTVVNNKWRRDTPRSGTPQPDGGAGPAEASEASVRSLLPPEISPSSEGFSPELYLATFHADTNLSQLRKGMRHLGEELSERTGQLKQLIKNNFERFISCKGTIDDIYLKLKKIQADKQGGTATLHKAIEQAQLTANQGFGEILERATKTDRIKSVSSLLRRFNNLFGIPGRIRSLVIEGDLQQIVREYRKANALIKPQASTPRVWISLYQEIEARVTEVYDQARLRLEDADVAPEEASALIVFLSELAAEKLPGTRDEDPLQLYLEAAERHMQECLEECEAVLQDELSALRIRHRSTKLQPAGSVPKLGTATSGNLLGRTGSNQIGNVALELMALGGIGGNSMDKELMNWPGPSDWSSEAAANALPSHLSTALAATSSTVTEIMRPLGGDLPRRGVTIMATTSPPSFGDISSSQFTPFQCAWVTSVSRATTEAVHRLPVVWAVCSSSKYAQAGLDEGSSQRGSSSTRLRQPGIRGGGAGSSGSAKSLMQAPQLGQDLISRVVGRLCEAAGKAVAELNKAGPMQPGLELIITDLTHTWLQLRNAGCPKDSISSLRTCLFQALGLYTRALAGMLQEAPEALLSEEDWKVGASSRGSPPTTQLPRRLQAVVTGTMRCYGAMLQVTRRVSEPPEADSWRPLQEGFFAAFSAFCASATELSLSWGEGSTAANEEPRKKGRDLNDKKTRRGPDDEGDKENSSVGISSSLDSDPDAGETSAGHGKRLGRAQKGRSMAMGITRQTSSRSAAIHYAAMSALSESIMMPEGAAADSAETVAAVARRRQLMLGSDAKLLAVMSNASVLRGRLLPSLAELHRPYLTGNSGQGESQLHRGLEAGTEALGTLISHLLSLYLERKQKQLGEAVWDYISSFKRGVTIVNQGASSLPLGLSDDLHEVLGLMLGIYTEAYAYTPATLRPIMAMMSEHLVSELTSGYSDLSLAGAELGDLMQLFLDLMFLDNAILASANRLNGGTSNGVIMPSGKPGRASGRRSGDAPSASIRTDLQPAYLSLAVAMTKAVSRQKKVKGRSQVARAISGAADTEQVVFKLQGILSETLSRVAEWSSINVRCFEL